MSGVLTPRDRGHRHRAARFREAVAWYLAGHGIAVTPREDSPKAFDLAAAIGDEDWQPEDRGSLVGLTRWSLQTASDYSHSWPEDLKAAKDRKGTKRWSAVIGYRRAPAAAADQFVMMRLEDFAEVVRVTEGLETP